MHLINKILFISMIAFSGASFSQDIIIKIGHVAPLTGALKHLGQDTENGVKLAIEDANRSEFLFNGKKAKFLLVSKDDEGSAQKSVVVAQQFVAENVAAVIGHLNSGALIAASEIYKAAGVPVVTASATNPKVTELGYPNIFRLMTRDDSQGQAVGFSIARTGKRRIVIGNDWTDYGKGISEQVASSMPNNVSLYRFNILRDSLIDLPKFNPDIIFFAGSEDLSGFLLQAARNSGITASFIFPDGACTERTLSETKGEIFSCSQSGLSLNSIPNSFINKYTARFGHPPVLYSPYAYDAANIVIASILSSNKVIYKNIVQEIKNIKGYVGVTGNVQFDNKGDRLNQDVTLYRAKDGKIEPKLVLTFTEEINSDDWREKLERGVDSFSFKWFVQERQLKYTKKTRPSVPLETKNPW